MRFKEWLVSEEMHKPVAKKDDNAPMVIRGRDLKTAAGHEANIPAFRTGAHDSRPKRLRTRTAAKNRAIKDSSD